MAYSGVLLQGARFRLKIGQIQKELRSDKFVVALTTNGRFVVNLTLDTSVYAPIDIFCINSTI